MAVLANDDDELPFGFSFNLSSAQAKCSSAPLGLAGVKCSKAQRGRHQMDMRQYMFQGFQWRSRASVEPVLVVVVTAVVVVVVVVVVVLVAVVLVVVIVVVVVVTVVVVVLAPGSNCAVSSVLAISPCSDLIVTCSSKCRIRCANLGGSLRRASSPLP